MLVICMLYNVQSAGDASTIPTINGSPDDIRNIYNKKERHVFLKVGALKKLI